MPLTRKPPDLFHRLLRHWMMGTVLGILCAGLLLMMSPKVSDPLVRVGLLMLFGLAFGLGATLTGAIFLASEDP